MADAPIAFVDVAADLAACRDDVDRRIDGVLERGVFVLGPETDELEARLASTVEAAHAVACSSGTEALVLALEACGVGRGDAVVVPALSFFATAGAVARLGATPVFADVSLDDYMLDATTVAAALERARAGARVRALLPVHLFGRAASMSALDEFARAHDLVVVEDAAQAIGARGDVAAVGAWGRAAALSFYPTKNLGGAGDGGAVSTGDDEVAARVRRLRVHGRDDDGRHVDVGTNARMGELQAAVLNAKHGWLGRWTDARRDVARRYHGRLADAEAAGRLRRPPLGDGDVFHQYAVQIPGGRRDRVAETLAAAGIETRVFYATPLHREPCFADVAPASGALPVVERLTGEVLCLPVRPSLTAAEVDRVGDALDVALEADR